MSVWDAANAAWAPLLESDAQNTLPGTTTPDCAESVSESQLQTGNRHRCGVCGRSWGGMNECHCSGCHRQFSSPYAFDLHRTGFKCLDPNNARAQTGRPIFSVTQRTNGAVFTSYVNPDAPAREWNTK